MRVVVEILLLTAGLFMAQAAPAQTAPRPDPPPNAQTAESAQAPTPGAADGSKPPEPARAAGEIPPNLPKAAQAPANSSVSTAPAPEQAPAAQRKKRKKKKADEPQVLAQAQTVVPNGDVAVMNGGTGALTGDPFGDEGGIAVGGFSFRILAQTRYTTTYASPSTNPNPTFRAIEDNLVQQGDGWKLNRLFWRVNATVSDAVLFKSILDFAELSRNKAKQTVKQAYTVLRPFPDRLEITAGLFKLPFSISELDPIARFELADLGEADGLTKNLGFAGSDVGVAVTVAPAPSKKLLRVAVGAFRGHSRDEHDSPIGAVGARVELRPVRGLRFGLDGVQHPQKVVYDQPLDTSKKDVVPECGTTSLIVCPDPVYKYRQTWNRGGATSADITFQRWRLMLRTEGMIGNRVDHDSRYEARIFGAVWALAAYRFRAGPVSLMPAARVEWLDGDLKHSNGIRRQMSVALNVIFSKAVRALVDVTLTDVQPNSPLLDQPRPLPYRANGQGAYLELDNTRVTAQLQAEL